MAPSWFASHFCCCFHFGRVSCSSIVRYVVQAFFLITCFSFCLALLIYSQYNPSPRGEKPWFVVFLKGMTSLQFVSGSFFGLRLFRFCCQTSHPCDFRSNDIYALLVVIFLIFGLCGDIFLEYSSLSIVGVVAFGGGHIIQIINMMLTMVLNPKWVLGGEGRRLDFQAELQRKIPSSSTMINPSTENTVLLNPEATDQPAFSSLSQPLLSPTWKRNIIIFVLVAIPTVLLLEAIAIPVFYFFITPSPSSLGIMSGYIIVLSSMAVSSALSKPFDFVRCFAGITFVVSDVCAGIGMFSESDRIWGVGRSVIGWVCMLTYVTAQYGFVVSVATREWLVESGRQKERDEE